MKNLAKKVTKMKRWNPWTTKMRQVLSPFFCRYCVSNAVFIGHSKVKRVIVGNFRMKAKNPTSQLNHLKKRLNRLRKAKR